MFISFLLSVFVVVRLYAPTSHEANAITPTPDRHIAVVTSTTVPTSILTPTLIPSPLPPTDYESLFEEFSVKHGADKELMKRIARCESGINPGSRNGIYGGMFQFAEQTWISTRSEMGLDTNIDLRFSARDAIEAAAYKIGKHGPGAWAGCL